MIGPMMAMRQIIFPEAEVGKKLDTITKKNVSLANRFSRVFEFFVTDKFDDRRSQKEVF